MHLILKLIITLIIVIQYIDVDLSGSQMKKGKFSTGEWGYIPSTKFPLFDLRLFTGSS